MQPYKLTMYRQLRVMICLSLYRMLVHFVCEFWLCLCICELKHVLGHVGLADFMPACFPYSLSVIFLTPQTTCMLVFVSASLTACLPLYLNACWLACFCIYLTTSLHVCSFSCLHDFMPRVFLHPLVVSLSHPYMLQRDSKLLTCVWSGLSGFEASQPAIKRVKGWKSCLDK